MLSLSACVESEPAPPPPPKVISLDEAIAAPYRGVNKMRDVYRHPLQTLEFFGIADDMTVVEVWPAGGWYTEILAPYLRARGRYVGAQYPDVPPTTEVQKRTALSWIEAVKAHPELYDRVAFTTIGTPDRWAPVPPGTADMVLTFRNVHNWLATNTEREMFATFYRSLKPGGVLGVEEHRAPDDYSRADMVRTGYVAQDLVIELAQQAGFVWVAWEEFNANPKDTKDYPGGVWSLPPTLRYGEQDKAKYLAIGESDRMTLKFVKPDPNAPRAEPPVAPR